MEEERRGAGSLPAIISNDIACLDRNCCMLMVRDNGRVESHSRYKAGRLGRRQFLFRVRDDGKSANDVRPDRHRGAKDAGAPSSACRRPGRAGPPWPRASITARWSNCSAKASPPAPPASLSAPPRRRRRWKSWMPTASAARAPCIFPACSSRCRAWTCCNGAVIITMSASAATNQAYSQRLLVLVDGRQGLCRSCMAIRPGPRSRPEMSAIRQIEVVKGPRHRLVPASMPSAASSTS